MGQWLAVDTLLNPYKELTSVTRKKGRIPYLCMTLLELKSQVVAPHHFWLKHDLSPEFNTDGEEFVLLFV